MYITYKQLFNLKELKKYKVVSGNDGLDRIINWHLVLDLKEGINLVNAGELVFLSGAGLEHVTEELLYIVNRLNEKKSAGLVIQTGPYINETPEAVKNLSDRLNLPIIEIPFESKINDITYAISKKIFDNYHEDKSMDELLKELMCLSYRDDMKEKAVFYGYEPQHSYIAIEILLENINEYIKDNNLYSQKKVDDLRNGILNFIKSEFLKRRIDILYTSEANGFILMVPINRLSNTKKELTVILDRIKNNIQVERKGLIINSGIGTKFDDIRDFKRSSLEAKQAARMLRVCNRKNDIRIYDEIGIYRLFFKINETGELESILESTLGKLIKYDIDYESDLVNTLEIYLDSNCNIAKTSEKLFIHRNTLKYRINRIEDILKKDLQNVNECFNLRLAFKIKKFLFNQKKINLR